MLFRNLAFLLLLVMVGPSWAEDIEDLSDPINSTANFDSSVTIKEVQVYGNELISDDVIRDAISTQRGNKFSRRSIAYDLQSLDNLGYFRRDKLKAIPVPQGEEGVVLRIEVVENSPLTGLIIRGNKSLERRDIEQYLTPLVGMPQSSTQIKKAIDKIESSYHDKGYLLASVTELHFDPDGYLTISIDEGTISKVEFSGNYKTQNEYLQKILPDTLRSGKPFNEEEATKYMQALHRMGFFKDVKREILTDPNDPSKHILSFKVEEQRTKALSFGTGIGTANGLFGNVSFTEPNFRGRGETLSLSGFAGTGVLTALDGDTGGRFARRGDFQFMANYTDPFFMNRDDVGLSLSSSALRQGSFLVDSAVMRSVSVGASFSKRFKDKPKWSFQGGFKLSHNDMANFGSAARDKLIASLSEEGHSTSSAEGIADSLRRSELQDGLYLDLTPSMVYRSIDKTGTGWKNTIFGGPSLAAGSAGHYLTAGVDVRRYDRLTEAGTLFRDAFRAEGLLGDPANFRYLRATGPYGMRGYRQFLDVGRGKGLLSNTAEIAIPVTIPKSPLNGTKFVFFNDLGLILGNNQLNRLYDRKTFVASIGFGVELDIPMLGPLRFDYGIPLLRPDNKSFFSGRLAISPGRQL